MPWLWNAQDESQAGTRRRGPLSLRNHLPQYTGELGHDTGPTEVLRTTALLRFCFTIIFLLFGVVLIVAAVVR